jgi:NUMOD1 domain.
MGIFIKIEKDDSQIVIDTRTQREKKLKAVQQFTLDNSLVAEYPSIAAAEKITGINHVDECVNNNRLTAGGYIWRLIGEE